MKLVMFDLDGTLLSHMHGVSERNREAFRKLKANGYHLGVATGRRVSNIEFILGEDLQYFDVLIGENGHQTKNVVTQESTFTRKLSTEEIKEIISLYNDPDKDMNFCYFDDDGTHFYRKSSFSENSEQDINRVVFYLNGEDFPPLPKMCMPVGKDLADEFRNKVEQLENDNYHGTMTGYGFFEFMSKETSKWKALEKYLKDHHIEIQDTIAFGDSGNDMEILSNVGFSVAMQNADQKVKDICHAVTQYSCVEDGVGRYIEDNLL